MVIAEHHHGGDQPDVRGAGGQECQRRNGIPVGGAALRRVVDGDDDMLGARQVVESEFVGDLGDAGDVLDVTSALPCRHGAGQLHDHGRGQSDPHARVISPSGLSRRTSTCTGCDGPVGWCGAGTTGPD